MAKKAASDNGEPTVEVVQKKGKLTIVFSGRFQALYDRIEELAKADDRDMDTFILRHLDSPIPSA